MGSRALVPFVLCLWLAAPAAEEAAAPGSAASLTTILDAPSALAFSDQPVAVRDKTFKIGRFAVTLADGAAVALLGKDKSVLGFYYEGTGGWTFTDDDPADRETFKTNVARNAKTLRLNGAELTDTLQKLLVLFTEPVAKDVWNLASGTAATLPDGATKSAGGILSLAGSSHPEFDFRLAQARLNGHGQWVYAEALGGLERVGYCYDDVSTGYETLFNFRKFVDSEVRFTQTLSRQRIAGWETAEDSWLTLRHAAISIDTPDNKRGTIDSTMTFHVKGAGIRLLPLRLVNNRDADSYAWDAPKNRLEVKRVVDDMGHELPFSHKYGELLVEIARTTAAESDVELSFETGGEVFLDMKDRHDDNYFSLLFGWYPTPATSRGEGFTFTIKARTRKPWRPVTSGREVSLKDDGDFLVAESRSDHPALLITTFGGKYITREETIEGLTVRVHAYAMARKNVLDNMPKLAAALAKFYSGLLGPMPADELDIVEVPEYGFGISPSGVILLTTEAYKPHQDDEANYLARGINARLAHEIAHQWFAHKAYPADLASAWLAESFAEYFSGMAMGALAASDKTVFGFDKMLAEWRADSKICSDVAPIAAASTLGGEHGVSERRCLLYSRGPLVLHMLRTTMGNDRFIAATKSYLDRANVGYVTTDDYARAVSEVVGNDMRWYFDQWIRSPGTPTIEVSQQVGAAQSGYRLFGTVREAAGDRFKKMLVPLVFDLNGRTEARVVFLDQPEKKFDFTISGKPSSVKVDPYQNNIANYK